MCTGSHAETLRGKRVWRVMQGQPRAAPGYGILLVAETTAGRYLSVERCICGAELLRCKEQEITASDTGQQAACMLLDEVQRCALRRHHGTPAAATCAWYRPALMFWISQHTTAVMRARCGVCMLI